MLSIDIKTAILILCPLQNSLCNGCFLYSNVKHLFTRWQQQTSDRIGMGLLFLYAMQVFTLGVYYTSDASLEEVEVREAYRLHQTHRW